jgi:hypothetical protein
MKSLTVEIRNKPRRSEERVLTVGIHVNTVLASGQEQREAYRQENDDRWHPCKQCSWWW